MVKNLYEDIACNYLLRSGFEILDRNYRLRGGEIDIIARRGRDVYFVEVRHRSRNSFETALESVTPGKMKKIVKIAVHFLTHRLKDSNCDYHFAVMDVGDNGVQEVVWDAFSLEDTGYYYWP